MQSNNVAKVKLVDPIITASKEDISSNAHNYLSFINTGVDPRTGSYNVGLTLPLPPSSGLAGPEHAVSLRFSPHATGNYGFGAGWSLNTTRWDAERMLLTLTSGETYRAYRGNDDTYLFPDLKLPSFSLTLDTADDTFIVAYRDGRTERLVQHGLFWVTSAVYAQDGRVINFGYEEQNGQARLMDVTSCSLDGIIEALLAVEYSYFPTLIFNPEASRAVRVTLELQSGEISDELRNIRIDTREAQEADWHRAAEWAFTYRLSRLQSQLLIETVSLPTGGAEKVVYDEEALPLPAGAPFSHMPAVIYHTVTPGLGQPDIVKLYSYITGDGPANCYGFGAVDSWADGQDNLYLLPPPRSEDNAYRYGSVESLLDINGHTLCRTTRIYNRYHMVELEQKDAPSEGSGPVELGCRRETRTRYHDDLDLNWEDQPTICHLPKTVVTRVAWLDRNNEETRSREEVAESVFDVEGNLLRSVDPDGTVTERVYFSAKGEGALCPPDPLNMRRHLKSETIFPPTTSDGPVLQTTYTYTALSTLTGCPLKTVILPASETLHQMMPDGKMIELQREEEIYIDDVTSPHHARLMLQKTSRNGFITLIHHEWQLKIIQDADGSQRPSLTETTVLTGHDYDATVNPAPLRRQVRVRDLQNGQDLAVTDSAGCTTLNAYDALGRLTATINAAGTDRAATSHTRWGCNNGIWYREHHSPSGMVMQEYLDGLGRPYRRDALAPDDKMQTIWTATYSITGDIAAERTIDRNVSGPASGELHLSVITTYDGWGNAMTVTSGPDADASKSITAHVHTDPVALTRSEWKSGGNERSAIIVTTSDVAGRPLTITRRVQEEDAPELFHRYIYDGIGQMVSEIDGRGNQTHYKHDAFGRVTEKQLPDGTRLIHGYNPATDESQVSQIDVIYEKNGQHFTVNAGKREYDGLGRIIEENTGGRTKRWLYQAGITAPVRSLEPDGNVVNCRYDAQLDEHPSRLWLNDSTRPHREWSYNPVTGSPLTATCIDGETRWTWRRDGLLEKEASVYNGVHHEERFSMSDGGWLNVIANGAVEESRTADNHGRLHKLQIGDAVTVFTWDDLGRLLTEQSTCGTQQSETRIAYDAYGREVSRTQSGSGGDMSTIRTASLTWDTADLLTSKSVTENGQISIEKYGYDARHRLISVDLESASTAHLPVDENGRPYIAERYRYDALDNLLSVETIYPGAAEQPFVRNYEYDSITDPFQLTRIQPGWNGAEEWLPQWDIAGRLMQDEQGRALTYHPDGSLATVGSVQYGYDALDRIASVIGKGKSSYRFYRDQLLVHEQADTHETAISRLPSGSFTESKLAGSIRNVLLAGADAQGSVVTEVTDNGVQLQHYGPWGKDGTATSESHAGYSGAVREEGGYLLGGYRWYSPTLRRFNAPDSLSPFGEGGLNPYAYAGNNPVMRIDPDGHSWLNWLIAGIGIVVGAIATVASFGAALPAVGAAMTASQGLALASASLGAVSLATSIAETTLEATGNKKAAGILGWISLGTGLADMAAGFGSMATKGASKAGKAVGGLRQKIYNVPRDPGKLLYKQYGLSSKHVNIAASPMAGFTSHTMQWNNRTIKFWSSKYTINRFNVENVVRSIPQHESITVFSGTHGSELGLRHKWHLDHTFYLQDKSIKRMNYKVIEMRRENMFGMGRQFREEDIRTGIDQAHHNVIFAFCHATNDDDVLHLLNRQRTKNYLFNPKLP